MLRFWEWALYKKPVEISGTRSLEDCVAVLGRMTRPAKLFRRSHGKAFVGSLEGSHKSVCYRPGGSKVIPRTLKFVLHPVGGGSVLRWHLEVTLPFRIFTLIYFFYATVASMVMVAGSIAHAHPVDWAYEGKLLLQGFACGFAVLYGYNGIGVLVGRGAERTGLKVIKHVMNSDDAEGIVVDLLDRSKD